ncbi:TetR/AcrR family transcriptional regulator [Sporomusa malonica]|uniref:Transcriptional regulator, TetR family n=1 Tax=Sporomusa malonica TaxID=112901 RepID=A0A1W2EI17_9FIRM|nr:TetR/AcrR family transcriptional regulator [Sporomusa malonica]SMD09092.1 transcriptional regulator, TetR family [Sporomusa malonica]
MKKQILFAAAQEMNERGVKFTIDSVAARLGISKKTVYQYYPSKDAIITSIIDAALADIDAQKLQAMERQCDFVSKLTAIITVEPKLFGKINYWVLDDIKRYRPQEWERINRFRQARVTDIGRMLEAGIASGHIRSINTKVAAKMLLSTCAELLDYRFLDENNLTFGDALKALNDIFQFGVLTGPAACQENENITQAGV